MVGEKSGSTPDHIPVLLDEVLKELVQSKEGVYVDATFGRGGHSRALLRVLDTNAQVIGLDQDPQAVAAGDQLAVAESRFTVQQARFSALQEVLAGLGLDSVDGVLMDLGVSSPQLDQGERGFSFRLEGPLDMRMNPGLGESAAEWLNRAEEADIAKVLKEYGEERFARRIARAIVAARPLQTTRELADVVAEAVPVRPGSGRGQTSKHPATRTFQAVRIFINDELAELRAGLDAAFSVLAPHGRLAVISFHSLEDKAVKQYFRKLTRPPPGGRGAPTH